MVMAEDLHGKSVYGVPRFLPQGWMAVWDSKTGKSKLYDTTKVLRWIWDEGNQEITPIYPATVTDASGTVHQAYRKGTPIKWKHGP